MKNKAILGLVCAIAMLFAATSVLGAVSLNTSSQNIVIDANPLESKSQTFNIRNTANEGENATGLSIALANPSDFIDNDGDQVNVTLTLAATTIEPNKTVSSTIKVDLPEDIDAGTYAGSVNIAGNGGASHTFTLTLNVKSLLRVSNIDIENDEFKPGEAVSIEVEVENAGEEIDMEDVNVRVWFQKGSTVLEDDEGDDIEDEIEIDSLDAGDSERVTFDFEMPYDEDLKDGDDYTVYVEVRADEADGSEKYKIVDTTETVSVQREKHEIVIVDASLDSGTLTCVKSTYLNVKLRNIGKDDSEDVNLRVESSALGLDEITRINDMSNNPDKDSFEVTESVRIDASAAPEGNYKVNVIALYDGDDAEVRETVDLVVSACSQQSTGSSSSGSGSGTADSGTGSSSSSSSSGSSTGSGSTTTPGTQIVGDTVKVEQASAGSTSRVYARPVSSKKSLLDNDAIIIGGLVLALLLVVLLIVLIVVRISKK